MTHILEAMTRIPRRLSIAFAILAVLAGAFAPTGYGAAPRRSVGPSAHALLASKELWATIDICNPPDQRDTVGIRGSMPGDGQGHDGMYMRFALQYRDPSNRQWLELAGASSPGFAYVGGGGSPRQGGWSFRLRPRRPVFTMRGVVTFQWRHGTSVIATGYRTTTAGRESLGGVADPAHFSAATCLVG